MAGGGQRSSESPVNLVGDGLCAHPPGWWPLWSMGGGCHCRGDKQKQGRLV